MFGVNLLAREEHVPIDQMPVELGAVNAGEACFAADFHPAPAAHAGAVDHHRVQADHRATPKGRVASVQNFIMIAGPIAYTQPIRLDVSSFSSSSSGPVTRALRRRCRRRW